MIEHQASGSDMRGDIRDVNAVPGSVCFFPCARGAQGAAACFTVHTLPLCPHSLPLPLPSLPLPLLLPHCSCISLVRTAQSLGALRWPIGSPCAGLGAHRPAARAHARSTSYGCAPPLLRLRKQHRKPARAVAVHTTLPGQATGGLDGPQLISPGPAKPASRGTVVCIGAGPAGTTAAMLLAQRGYDVHVSSCRCMRVHTGGAWVTGTLLPGVVSWPCSTTRTWH